MAAAATTGCGPSNRGGKSGDNSHKLDVFALQRETLLLEIAEEARQTASLTGRGEFSSSVMTALRQVPRHAFVAPQDRMVAYGDFPLPIGHGQTISQPFVVALMTDLLDIDDRSVVLEVGAGCGYQAAVLGEIAGEVYAVERIPELAAAARERLDRLGYRNVAVLAGDGYFGLPSAAPFDAIVVTAAAVSVPPPLVEQLKIGGRLVIPLGPPYGPQELQRAVKQANGALAWASVLPVAFVPFRH